VEDRFDQFDLVEIEGHLAEYAAACLEFVSWASEAVEPEGDEGLEFPWYASFVALAGWGRVTVHRAILEDHSHTLNGLTKDLLRQAGEVVDLWLSESYNQVASYLDLACPFLLATYRNSYLVGAARSELGWSFDDFIEERDLLEFFLIGVGDHFPLSGFPGEILEHDCRVRERIAELGLEAYADEYFPNRVTWFPSRFWWHHPPEQRTVHPDGLEA